MRALACVIGDIDLVRPLGRAGIPCALAYRDGALPARSRFVRALFPWVDPAADPDGFVDAVVEFARRQDEPPVLFYEGDWDLLAISRHRERLAQTTRFLLPGEELVEDLLDKARFQRLAQRLDLPVPRAVADPGNGQPPFPLPVVIKPLTRNSATWCQVAGNAKAIEVGSAEALASVASRLRAAGVDLLVQESVPGPETSIESYHVYVDAAGEVAADFTGRKIRTEPERFGHSSAVETTTAPDVAELGRELSLRMGLRGVAKLDFKRAPDGGLRLLEVNPRFNLWHHVGAAAGVNLPALVYADLTGRPRPEVGQARPGVRWCHPVLDFSARRTAGIPLSRWLPWLAGTHARSGLALDDPMPVVARALSGRVGGN